jgi:hypothetical protein
MGVYPYSGSLDENYTNISEPPSTWAQSQLDEVWALYTSVSVGEETPLIFQIGVQGDTTPGVSLSYLALHEGV